MTLTDTLDHLLSVFLRPLRTWIEREFIVPWRAAYDAAMQTKEQYRDGVYLHLKERLEGTDEKPLAEGVPVRPLPEVQDLEHLQEAVELLDSRKVDVGTMDIDDGRSLMALFGDSTYRNRITEITDSNIWGTLEVENLIDSLIKIFPNLSYLEIGCNAINSILSSGSPQELEIHFIHCKSIRDEKILGYYNNCQNMVVHLDELENVNQTSNGPASFYVKKLYFDVIKTGQYRVGGSSSYGNSVTSFIYIGCKGEPTDTIQLWHYYDNSSVTDIEIRDGAKQPIILGGRGGGGQFVGLTAENIVNHIFNRLADNNDGDPITITLGSTNLAKLTDEEKQIAIDKNYILA